MAEKVILRVVRSTAKENEDLMKKKVLFLCTHNSARSQIAEGYLNAKHNEPVKSFVRNRSNPCAPDGD